MITDSFISTAFVADTTNFVLKGGIYQVAFVKSGSQTAQLQLLGPDKSTYIGMHTALSATGMSGAVYCPPGTYKIAAGTADSSAVSVARVPIE